MNPKPMEQIKPRGANFEARTVKDIIEPAKSISNKVSVRAALDQMQAQAIDSSPVIDQRGELLGILSKNKMNRNVGGFGHDPKTEPVEAHIEKNNAYCFEDQTIAEAEQIMLNAKLGEVFVVTREKLLVGTINIEAIAEEGKKLGQRLNSKVFVNIGV
jgi:predicted transcriptional regulator